MHHVIKANDDITNFDSSINMHIMTLNEEISFDMKIKKKITVKLMINGI
jgi:hypothetical protein